MSALLQMKALAFRASVNVAKLRVCLGGSLCLALTLVACSRSEESPSARAEITESRAVATAKPQSTPTACSLISEAEMSAILGNPVTAQSGDGYSFAKSSCVWSPKTGYSPYAELTIEWGSGEAAMYATGILSGIEPGLTSPFEGLGDQASAVGPTIMIRRGEDLITIILAVEDDRVPIVRKIYEAIDARL